MTLFEGKTPAERNKLLAALALPLVALILVFRMFFASDKPTPKPNATKKPTGSPTQSVGTTLANGATGVAGEPDEIAILEPVPPVINASYAPDAARNIFAFYARPVAATTAAPATPALTPTPTPTPPPPLMLGSLQPAGVFARTGDFTLDLTGDKFTPQTRVYLDGQELPTTFKSPQQLSAKVTAGFVQSPGSRAVIVRTPDNVLYSNTQTVNVMPPPTPQYTFIGIIGTRRFVDKAILKPTVGNDPLTIQRGDVVGGRFKVTSISERAVEFTDTQLNIKHSLPYSESKGAPGGLAPRFPQPPSDDDVEP